jgi:hypothetical protein
MARELAKANESMLHMVGESTGISGWHLNGDLIEWGQVEPVSEMESALARFNAMEKGTE